MGLDFHENWYKKSILHIAEKTGFRSHGSIIYQSHLRCYLDFELKYPVVLPNYSVQ